MITEAQILQYIDSIGGPEALKRDFEQSEADRNLLFSQYDSLLARYPDMFVAVYKGNIEAAPDIEELVRKLDQKGIPSQFAVVWFLATKPEVWVL
ncbi:MAG: hypothetical protein HY681_08450 [Chloroflexi bacterium]|nr:hypothetical protein [Chloroflexota bacterium]